MMVFIDGKGTNALGRLGLTRTPIEMMRMETMPDQVALHP
jgi:hypothetical protein